MFDGEFQSLGALYATNIVKVPKPICVVDNPEGGAILITEYIDMRSGLGNYASELGKQLARLQTNIIFIKITVLLSFC